LVRQERRHPSASGREIEMSASKVVREGNVVVFKIPVSRLLRLTRRDGRYEIFRGDDYVEDMIASLNRRSARGMTEIESMFVAEVEHVHEMGFESVRRFGYMMAA
jgi:hypothetical protein